MDNEQQLREQLEQILGGSAESPEQNNITGGGLLDQIMDVLRNGPLPVNNKRDEPQAYETPDYDNDGGILDKVKDILRDGPLPVSKDDDSDIFGDDTNDWQQHDQFKNEMRQMQMQHKQQQEQFKNESRRQWAEMKRRHDHEETQFKTQVQRQSEDMIRQHNRQVEDMKQRLA